jgi:hypothetical protein
MTNEDHHATLIKGIAKEQKPILDRSGQAVYIYLDDTHKICNKKFAAMLGYKSIKEWVDNETPVDDIVEKDQPKFVDTYLKTSEKLEAASLPIRFNNVRTGELVKARMVLSPIVYEGHVFVIHFLDVIQ